MDAENILEIKDLVVHYEMDDGVCEAVNGVDLTLKKGEVLGLVGETGAGKTTIALSIMGLLPIPPSHIVRGSILLEGKEIIGMKSKELQKIRGNTVSMIFQDPMTSLNPVLTVGDQISEVIQIHQKLKKGEADVKASQLLETVGIPSDRFKEYPHQFSGGMKQRVVIAMALACNPALLLADEPTTALDVTIQAQVLDLMRELREKYDTSMILITHDFGVVAEICDTCAVVYAGEIVEYGTLKHIFKHPTHPYTKALFESLPRLDKKVKRLKVIDGLMSDPMNLPPYCSFYNRCDHACERCKEGNPEKREIEQGHWVRCHLVGRESAE